MDKKLLFSSNNMENIITDPKTAYLDTENLPSLLQ